ncbi:hypothetical protein FB451DRAFT_1193920 [Mycena latifolia]|nr:hypothetical protein FB451DRAFT_1193920 [Mycena latifolia]
MISWFPSRCLVTALSHYLLLTSGIWNDDTLDSPDSVAVEALNCIGQWSTSFTMLHTESGHSTAGMGSYIQNGPDVIVRRLVLDTPIVKLISPVNPPVLPEFRNRHQQWRLDPDNLGGLNLLDAHCSISMSDWARISLNVPRCCRFGAVERMVRSANLLLLEPNVILTFNHQHMPDFEYCPPSLKSGNGSINNWITAQPEPLSSINLPYIMVGIRVTYIICSTFAASTLEYSWKLGLAASGMELGGIRLDRLKYSRHFNKQGTNFVRARETK